MLALEENFEEIYFFDEHDPLTEKRQIRLRPKQLGALAAYSDWVQSVGKAPLIQKATGTGKALVIAHLPYKRMLVLAHRDRLCEQLFQTLKMSHPNHKIGLEKAESVASLYDDVVVASVQTIGAARKNKDNEKEITRRLQKWPKGHFDIVVVDEAHHCTSASYLRIFQYFGAGRGDGPVLVGLTATPFRGDGKPLSNIFDSKDGQICFKYTIEEATNDGWLCDLEYRRVHTNHDISQLQPRGEDLNPTELSQNINTYSRNDVIISAIEKYAENRKHILIFAADIDHAEELQGQFVERGHLAEVVHYKIDKDSQKNILKRFETGEVRILINVAILTEGVDLPRTDCLVFARPTRSLVLLSQCLDSKTEILTERGFVGINEITYRDKCAAFNPETKQITYETIKHITKRKIGNYEKMVSYSNNHIDFRVTDRHRMLVRSRFGRQRHTVNIFEEAKETLERKDVYSFYQAGTKKTGGLSLTDSEIEFLGWWITDGWITKDARSIGICQNTNQPHLQQLEKCIQECGFSPSVYDDNRSTNFGPRSASIRKYIFAKYKSRKGGRGWVSLEVFLDKNISERLFELNKAQFDIFLNSVWLGDGSKQRKPYYSRGKSWTRRTLEICSQNKLFADRLQQLSIHNGYRCSVTQRPDGLYLIRVKKSIDYSSINANRSAPKISKPIKNEIVWCVENKIGTLITRRNGKIVIMGNCLGRGTRNLCVECGSTHFEVLRTQPFQWHCNTCGRTWDESQRKTTLVLDMVDLCGTLDIRSAMDMFDAREIDLLGTPIREALPVIRAADTMGIVAEPGEDIEKLKVKVERMKRLVDKTKYVDTYAEAVDLFSSVRRVEREEFSMFPWQKLGADRFLLFGPKGERMGVWKNDLGEWWIGKQGFGKEKIGVQKEAPWGKIDKRIKQYLPDPIDVSKDWSIPAWRMIGANVRWRKKAPDERDIKRLNNLGVKQIPEGLNKGEIRDMINLLEYNRGRAFKS